METTVIAQTDLKLAALHFWKMNLLAVSEDHGVVAAGNGQSLRLFDLQPDFTAVASRDVAIPHNPHSTETPEINRVRLCHLDGELGFVIGTMDAQVVFIPTNPSSEGFTCMNNYLDTMEDNSTWSVDCSGRRMAAGSNSHTVAVWESASLVTRLRDHEHNVPCVEFSPAGRYLASTSICTSLLIWEHDRVIAKFSPSEEWGWAVKWLPKSCFMGELKETDRNEDIQELILVHCTQTEIRLFSFESDGSPNMEQDMKDGNANLFGHTRFSLVDAIPSLSLLVVGEWGGTRVYFFQLVKSGQRYTAMAIHTHLVSQLLVGLAVDSVPGTKKGRVYLLMTNSTFQVLEVKFPSSLSLSSTFI